MKFNKNAFFESAAGIGSFRDLTLIIFRRLETFVSTKSCKVFLSYWCSMCKQSLAQLILKAYVRWSGWVFIKQFYLYCMC